LSEFKKDNSNIINLRQGVSTIKGGVADMSRKCEVCGKGQVSGNRVSHSNRHTRRKWNANIQSVRVENNGTVKRTKVCTRCIRSNKITRAI